MKKYGFASLCLAMIITLSPFPITGLCANANSYYKEVNELSGIEFASFKKLSDYVNSLNGVSAIKGVDPEVSDYLLSADEIYVPAGISTDNINKILITPTYIELYFDYSGAKMQFSCYLDPDVGKRKLDEAKLMGNSANGKNTVYCYEMPYFNDYESYYVWKQDNKYFQLMVDGKSKDEYITLCNAVKHNFQQNSKSQGLQKINSKLYYVNSDGTYATGWQTIDGNKYYFKDDGSAVTKNTTIDGKRYKFASDGKCLGTFTGWFKLKGNKYYYKKGVLQTGWFTVKGKKYYAAKNGIMRTGWVAANGDIYYFGENGVWDGKTYKSWNHVYKPKTVGDFLLDFDYPTDALYEINYNEGKYVSFENIELLKEILENESKTKFVYDDILSDDEAAEGLNYPNKNAIMIRSTPKQDEDKKMPHLKFSKDSSGNVYLYCPFYNFGCILEDNSVYDMLLSEFEDNLSVDYGYDEFGDVLE